MELTAPTSGTESAEWEARVGRLPAFDPAWPETTQARWLSAFGQLWREARCLELKQEGRQP